MPYCDLTVRWACTCGKLSSEKRRRRKAIVEAFSAIRKTCFNPQPRKYNEGLHCVSRVKWIWNSQSVWTITVCSRLSMSVFQNSLMVHGWVWEKYKKGPYKTHGRGIPSSPLLAHWPSQLPGSQPTGNTATAPSAFLLLHAVLEQLPIHWLAVERGNIESSFLHAHIGIPPQLTQWQFLFLPPLSWLGSVDGSSYWFLFFGQMGVAAVAVPAPPCLPEVLTPHEWGLLFLLPARHPPEEIWSWASSEHMGLPGSSAPHC